MNDFQNYTPGESLYVFGKDATLKLDATFSGSDKTPTINIELQAGKRLPGKPGLVSDHTRLPVNIQLDTFELVALTGVFLGHLNQTSIVRNTKYIEVKRQKDFKTGGASCYVVGKGEDISLGVPIISSRVFCASMLCLSRLSLLHPGVPMSALLDSLAGAGLSGNEQVRTDDTHSPNRSHYQTPLLEREIPEIHSDDPARRMRTTSTQTNQNCKLAR